MRLYTVQPFEVLDAIEKNGYFVCTKEKSVNYDDFHDAYEWLSQEMIKRGICPEYDNTLPVWAWYLHGGLNKLDLSKAGLGIPKERMVCLEIEVPENQVLLSDFIAWHDVLNDSWSDDSKNEQEFDALHEWFDALPSSERERIKIDSWQRIFDISPINTDWRIQGYYVQATFWKLTEDMIKNVRTFTAR